MTVAEPCTHKTVQPFTGVILAGGASRRMGRDKAKLKAGGITMLEHSRRILVQAGATRTVVLGRESEPDGIADRHPLAGPASAIIDYLRQSPIHSRHIIIPVDMPALTPDIIQNLAQQKVWAHYKGYVLPLLAISEHSMPLKCKRLQDLTAQVGALDISVLDRKKDMFINLNQPAELLKWRAIQQRFIQ